jgi:cell filamentation protein
MPVSRYGTGLGGEDQFEPGSGGLVLKNLIGVKDPREMEVQETRALMVAYDWSLERFSGDSCFSFVDLREMHKRWLSGIYEFAGSVRTVNLSKGDVMFAPAEHLHNSIREFEVLLQGATPCRAQGTEDLARIIALVHGEFILVHPFREGNGRLGRWLADLMSFQAGGPTIDWQFDIETDRRRDEYHAAMREAFAKRFSALEELVSDGLARGAEQPGRGG